MLNVHVHVHSKHLGCSSASLAASGVFKRNVHRMRCLQEHFFRYRHRTVKEPILQVLKPILHFYSNIVLNVHVYVHSKHLGCSFAFLAASGVFKRNVHSMRCLQQKFFHCRHRTVKSPVLLFLLKKRCVIFLTSSAAASQRAYLTLGYP